MTNILVIGASGFVGKHLIRRLLENKDISIRVLGTSENKILDSRIKFCNGNALDLPSLRKAIMQNDVVINLLYMRNVDSEINLQAIRNLVRACKESGANRLVHCSSVDVYGRVNGNIVNELTLCNPLSAYARNKFEIDNIIFKASESGLRVYVLRPTAIFGDKGQNLKKHINDLNSKSRFILYLKSCLFYRRQLNLIAVENVIEAINFVIFIDTKINKNIFILSDDDDPQNNFCDLEKMLMKYLKIPYYKILPIPAPQFILKLILFVLNKDNVNPMRKYSSDKLKKYGFIKKLDFDVAIKRFAEISLLEKM